MPVTDITIDEQQRTITVTAEYSVGVERLWNAYLDPRQIERFWAPPALSARFLRHDAFAGGISRYEIYGEDDEVYGGYWRWESLVAPSTFAVTDGFADEYGEPIDDAPTMTMRYALTAQGDGSKLVAVATFPTTEDLHTTLEMGVEAGTRAAMGQIDQLLDTLAPYSTDCAATVQRISRNQVRISRLLEATVHDTWNAHTDPELLKVWKLGNDGWSMPVCEFAAVPGTEYTMEWKNELGGQSFGIFGEVIEVVTDNRLVLTEQFMGEETAESLHEYTFTSFGDFTLVTCVVTYSHEVDDHDAPEKGMAKGLEEGFERLERLLAH